jgi:hypothetical protein
MVMRMTPERLLNIVECIYACRISCLCITERRQPDGCAMRMACTLQFQQWRAMDVFLIDAQPSMHQECGMEADVRALLRA